MAPLSVPAPDSKLCVFTAAFPLTEQSHTPPRRLLAEPSWELYSHWLGRTLGRIWEVLLCLRASKEKSPITTVTLGNQTIYS